jgi:hypothetical protein
MMTQRLWQLTAQALRIMTSTALALLVVIFPATAMNEGPLEVFIGKWQSNGAAFGRPAISTIEFTPSFEGQFVHLQYAIRIIEDDKHVPAFSGGAYYKKTKAPFIPSPQSLRGKP